MTREEFLVAQLEMVTRMLREAKPGSLEAAFWSEAGEDLSRRLLELETKCKPQDGVDKT